MPFIQVNDFKQGMDRTRKRVVAPAGSMWDLVNCHLTRGGDVERNKRFVPQFSLPAGQTFGLSQVRGQIYTFGSAASPTMPVGVQYQRLDPGDGSNMVKLLDARSYDGNFFAGAEFDNGNIGWFYNGTRIATLDTLADSNSTYNTLADYFASKINSRTDVVANSFTSTVVVTAVTAGTAFTISTATLNGGGVNDQTAVVTTLQANVPAVAETRATATVTVTGGTQNIGVNRVTQVLINGVNVLANAVDFQVDLSTTAAALAAAITGSGLSSYTAASVGAVVTITAPAGTGATANGISVSTVVAGDVTTGSVNFAGGVTAVAAVAQVSQVAFGGTYEALDKFTITINGTGYVATGRASGHMTSAFIYKKRVYGVANSLLRYCAISAPTDWSTATPSSGSSFINMNSDSEGSERLTAIEQYQTYVGIWSRRQLRLYALNTDATTNTFIQTLQNTGTVAPRSVLAYGNTDVFYLDQTGIRSVKARDASNAAFVSDIGTKVDPYVKDYTATISAESVQRAFSIVDPIDGRFWLSIGSKIFVLSYYPSQQIQGWSHYDMSGNVDGLVVAFNNIYVRVGDTILLYGGITGAVYPNANEQIAVVKTGFLSANEPANMKNMLGFDIACTNVWVTTCLPDPRDETKSITLGRFFEPTYGDDNVATNVRGGTLAFEFTCSAAGAATLSSFTAHFNKDETR